MATEASAVVCLPSPPFRFKYLRGFLATYEMSCSSKIILLFAGIYITTLFDTEFALIDLFDAVRAWWG